MYSIEVPTKEAFDALAVCVDKLRTENEFIKSNT